MEPYYIIINNYMFYVCYIIIYYIYILMERTMMAIFGMMVIYLRPVLSTKDLKKNRNRNGINMWNRKDFQQPKYV